VGLTSEDRKTNPDVTTEKPGDKKSATLSPRQVVVFGGV
jgi:hypothetical protein